LTETKPKIDIDVLASLAKRRGFIFQSSEIYGGLGSTWDYGPLGVELKRNVKELWWRHFVLGRDDMVGLDSAVLMHPKVWEASGHVSSFSDPLVECKNCHHRFREDHLDGEVCPDCGGELMEARQFNLMFKTFLGPVEETASEAYLRPETAQGIFVNFENVMTTTRRKPPFGIAQVGKAFRNEVTPRNFTFRSREFEQMEMEFFVHPDEERQWFDYWLDARHAWYASLGINPERLRRREHAGDELAHYASYTTDVEYKFPFGWAELEGVANRGNFDLTQHGEHSGKDQAYFDPARNEKYVPSVIETSAGLDRTLLTVLADAYDVDEVGGDERTVLRLAPHLAPTQVAVFPLSKKLAEPARKLTDDLRGQFHAVYDDSGSIGKRYRREDEVGTPFCVTFDFESLDDNAVTVRDRDTTEQERIGLDQLAEYLGGRIGR